MAESRQSTGISHTGVGDVEQLAQLREGYSSLADAIATVPDYELFLFKRFDRLAARNLLHLESQLLSLEKRLEDFDAQTRSSGEHLLKRSARTWEVFEENAKDRARPEAAWMQLVHEISAKLEEYQEALLRQRKIASMDTPGKRPLHLLREWFLDQGAAGTAGKPVAILGGRATDRLAFSDDLVALRPPAEKDTLTQLLRRYWFLRATPNRGVWAHTEQISERHLSWAVAVVSTVVAALLLIGAIISLYFVEAPDKRLAMIASYTVAFAISVSLFTNAKRAEIFAATAAYAAVLVVFVSGDLGSPDRTSRQ